MQTNPELTARKFSSLVKDEMVKIGMIDDIELPCLELVFGAVILVQGGEVLRVDVAPVVVRTPTRIRYAAGFQS